MTDVKLIKKEKRAKDFTEFLSHCKEEKYIDEKIIKIQCISCKLIIYVNDKLGVDNKEFFDAKEFYCPCCGKKRFKKFS